MPATAVGSAKGRSTRESTKRRPVKRYRTSTHATTSPNTAFRSAASTAIPKLTRNAESVRGEDNSAAIFTHPASLACRNSTHSGMITISPRYDSVMPSVSPNPGMTLRLRTVWNATAAMGSAPGSINLIEQRAIGEMRAVHLCPAAELVDADELKVGKSLLIALLHLDRARTEIELGCEFLRFRRIQKGQIGFRRLPGAVLVDDPIDYGDRRLREDTERGDYDLELARGDLVRGEQRLVFPGDQHVADLPARERDGRSPRAGIQHRNVPV